MEQLRVRVELGHAALEEIDEAAHWYDQQRQGTGEDLVDAVKQALDTLAQHPELGPVVIRSRRVRRLPIRRFPYQIVYQLHPDALNIIAFAHTSRRPSYWRNRL